MTNVNTFRSFADLPVEWRKFVDQYASTFDQSLPWYQEFERHIVEPAQKVRLITVTSVDGKPLAFMPMRFDSVKVVGPFSASALCSLSNYYTALTGATGGEMTAAEVAPALVRGLLDDGQRVSVVDFNPIASDSVLLQLIGDELTVRGFHIEKYFRFGNWFHNTEGRSSREYFASLPGKVRSTLERKGKKLRARADCRIRIVRDAADVNAAVDAYEAVYRNSWKSDEPYKDFIRAICVEFANRGWLRLGLIEIESRPVAAQIWFTFGGVASIFKLAYEPEFGNLSVGSLLTQALMEHVIDQDKVATIDYLCGDDDYKRDWMTSRRERVGIRAIRGMSVAGACVLAINAAKALKKRQPNV